ncbi:N-acetylmuramoyl-L-alanine amidase [Muricauda sp. 2012CJ35-5]|uniref:N-acetylmuramoyl-L-alanine amidase n=1 Tax=Flagellimonas spongiicola TaxID=2942208 RepID=A0ABT0PT00_9FLAO|nr:N-acetylmuramoyl-L-alanine amidase [Allomuricauda spongiicola]MCL6273862.1 N-acetylmuramoyl-L-alanine amidase [Allomuricauda spongiicola]
MKLIPALLLWVGVNSVLFAQEDYYTVTAQKGDGIYSILRKQGLDPVKHYESFVLLNEKDIKDGSLLHVGREYKIPVTDDSYKKKGMILMADNSTEKPIFDKELGQMSHSGSALKNAVYYIILEDSSAAASSFMDDVSKNLAAKLLEQGASVFVMGGEEEAKIALTPQERLGNYVASINKRFLQNQGKYQRLLVIKSNGTIQSGNLDVMVFHHDKSEQGQRMAENLQQVFKKNSIVKREEASSQTFEDKNMLFLAKNALPAVSLITLSKQEKTGDEVISVRSDKRKFANWITDGILKDYADLQIEN